MERIDLFDREGHPLGRARDKHAPRVPGEYGLHAIIILKTEDSPLPGKGEGQYILQQRSLKARFYAGKWDVTGGGVHAGETPVQAAVREAAEELSLTLSPECLQPFHHYRVTWDDGSGLLITVFACRVHVPEAGIRFDPYEVNDVRIVPFHTFYEHVMDHNDEAFGDALRRIEQTV
ncbi:MAG: NUDIX domain-containing protein [Clostridia bacterium]|nr:NUDIX domain-containing protein [Clostridia bacterium]